MLGFRGEGDCSDGVVRGVDDAGKQRGVARHDFCRVLCAAFARVDKRAFHVDAVDQAFGNEGFKALATSWCRGGGDTARRDGSRR